MVDFAKLKEQNVKRLAYLKDSPPTEKPPSLREPKPVAADRDFDQDKAMVATLLGTARHKLNDWELNFCESLLNRMLKYGRGLTEKQAEVLEKTWILHVDGDSDPTPKGNPPAQFTKTRAPPAVFDDIDDDIPF